jgi:DNA-binding NarL/FixJ family response regulator
MSHASAAEVLHAIRAVHAGDAVIAPSTTCRMLDHLATARVARDVSPLLKRLTPRERDVLLEIARGHSNSETAQRLFLSEATVKTHVGHLLAKLEVCWSDLIISVERATT